MGWNFDPDHKNGWDNAADGAGGANAGFTGGNGAFQMYQNATHTGTRQLKRFSPQGAMRLWNPANRFGCPCA